MVAEPSAASNPQGASSAMRIDVTGRHLEITPAIEQYAQEKCEKLPKYFNGVQQIRVVLEQVENNEYEAEVIADVVHHDDFIGRSRGEQLYACVDEAVEKVARQLTDFKEKLRDARH